MTAVSDHKITGGTSGIGIGIAVRRDGPFASSVRERSDAARNRARLLAAARRLVGERGADRLTMQAVADEAGVGKATLFRRFGDRDGLLLALLDEAEADFHEAYTSGPPPLGPGAPAADRLTAFGCALIERTAAAADLGAALGRRLLPEHRNASDTGRAFHHHVSTLLRRAGVDGDHGVLAHALLAFTNFETADYLGRECGIPVARLQAGWADLVQRVTRSDGGDRSDRNDGDDGDDGNTDEVRGAGDDTAGPASFGVTRPHRQPPPSPGPRSPRSYAT